MTSPRMPQPRASTLLLRNVPLFDSLSDPQRDILAQRLKRRSHVRGETIVQAGDPTQCLYIIISGRAQVVLTDSKDRRVILAILRPGEYFGEMSLLDDCPRSASVIAREACELLVLAKEELIECLKSNPQLTLTVARGLAKRLRNADRRIGSLALLDVYGRVAQVLLQEAEPDNGLQVVRGGLSKQDIARMIGASRERVSRIMKDLEGRGYIETRGSSIYLRDLLGTPE